MTLKEKLAKEKPEALNPDCYGGCEYCPGSYWRDKDYPVLGKCLASNLPFRSTCEECWNSEIPGETNEEKETDDMKPIKFKKDSDKKPTYAIIEIPEGYGRIMSFTLTGADSEGLKVFTASYDLAKGTMVRLDKDKLETGRIEYIQE